MSNKKFKLYKASAGSGKTYTLVREYLTICLSCNDRSCKDILAVTFTNKSANDMKAKILYNLEGIIKDYPKCKDMKKDLMTAINIDEAALKSRAEKLYETILHNYSDFSISTIDSFVQQISRGFSKELNLPFQYKVLLDDDDLLDELIQIIDKMIVEDDKYITEILIDFINFQVDEEKSWRIDFSIRNFVKKLLKESAYKRGESLEIKELKAEEYKEVKDKLNSIYEKCEDDIKDSLQKIKEFECEYGMDQKSYQGGSYGLPSIIRKIDNDIYVEPSSVSTETVKKILSGEKDWFSKTVKKTTMDRINKDGVDVVGLYAKLLENHQDLFLVNLVRKNLYLYTLRGILLNVINQYIDDTNKVHISEFNKRISDIIGDCSIPFIYERIGTRYKHFFIDEFQDTSLLQWRNFLPLINNSLSEGKMNLLVGDAKQAIYRFRSGEVEQIIKLPEIHTQEEKTITIKEYEDSIDRNFEEKSLDTNYRSRKNIIDFNNEFFKQSRHRLSPTYFKAYEKNLEQKCAKKTGEYDGYVSVEIFKSENFVNDDKISPKKLYKDAVKKSIVEDIKNLKEKGFSYKDITILIRSNADGSDIADFLTKNDIPVTSSDSISLKSSDKVRLIILTLRYLMDDANDVVKLGLAFYHNRCMGADVSEGVQKLLTSNYADLGFDNLCSDAYSLYDLCDGIIRMYNFNVAEDVFLQYFMNLVHDWQNSENGGADAFIEYWDKKSRTFFVKNSADIDAVRIMTIHKSKGLEFKVVMYPYAYTKVPDLLHGNEKWLSLGCIDRLKDVKNIEKFILPVNKSLVGTKMENHYTEEVEKAAFDDFNILYVAMTRPSDLMFIYTEDKTSSEKGNFFTDFFDAAAASSDKDIFTIDSDRENSTLYKLGDIYYCKDDEDDSEVAELELDPDNVPESLVWTDPNILRIETDPTMFWDDEKEATPNEKGVLIHEILSKINTIEDSQSVLDHYLNEGSIDENLKEELFRKFLEIKDIEDISPAYSKDAIVKNEVEILTSDKEILRLDRYVELPDKIIIIDYKTGKYSPSYEDKIRKYMRAVNDMGCKKTVEAYLLFLDEKVEVKPVYLDTLF